MVQDLKPLIDAKYPTLPDRENTAIGGSSMGGLMSLYGVTAHNETFSRAACLSPSVRFSFTEVKAGIRKAKLAPGTRVYISWGEREGNGRHALAQYTGKALEVTNLLTAGVRRSTLLPAGRQALRGRLAASAGALLYISVRMEVSRGKAKQKQKKKRPARRPRRPSPPKPRPRRSSRPARLS